MCSPSAPWGGSGAGTSLSPPRRFQFPRGTISRPLGVSLICFVPNWAKPQKVLSHFLYTTTEAEFQEIARGLGTDNSHPARLGPTVTLPPLPGTRGRCLLPPATPHPPHPRSQDGSHGLQAMGGSRSLPPPTPIFSFPVCLRQARHCHRLQTTQQVRTRITGESGGDCLFVCLF